MNSVVTHALKIKMAAKWENSNISKMRHLRKKHQRIFFLQNGPKYLFSKFEIIWTQNGLLNNFFHFNKKWYTLGTNQLQNRIPCVNLPLCTNFHWTQIDINKIIWNNPKFPIEIGVHFDFEKQTIFDRRANPYFGLLSVKQENRIARRHTRLTVS